MADKPGGPRKTPRKTDGRGTPSKAERKIAKRITASYLHNAGLYYLQRFSASSAQFRRVMLRKVDKSCRDHPEQDRAACAALVDTLVETFVRSGLLDDQRYAAANVATLRRRGESARAIERRLAAKGLPGELVTAELAAAEGEGHDDLRAALRHARRRRVGPFATTEIDAKKALAAFARAGFSFQIAKTVLGMSGDDADRHCEER